ncbi:MAG: S1C family serine protease [Candidatus Aquicultorales bacterium]
MKRFAYLRILAVLAIPALLPVTAGCNNAASVKGAKTTTTGENIAANVARSVAPSVVAVITRGTGENQEQEDEEGQPQAEGSGVVFRADGYIITNAHVIQDPDNTFVDFLDGSEIKARVIGTDTFSDIAIIKVERDNLPLPRYGNSDDVRAGQTAIAIGNPFGLENTVTEGIVSATRRSIPGGAPSLTNMIQTDAGISPGNSGGALVNKDSQVIGITTAFIPPQTGAVSLGFAVPVDVARRVGNQLIDNGRATHAFLGLSPDSLTVEQARQLNVPVNQGAVASEVVEGGPAADAGLQRNDVIIRMDGIPIRTSDDVFGVVNAHAPGDKITVDFYRGQNKDQVEVTLGERTSE